MGRLSDISVNSTASIFIVRYYSLTSKPLINPMSLRGGLCRSNLPFYDISAQKGLPRRQSASVSTTKRRLAMTLFFEMYGREFFCYILQNHSKFIVATANKFVKQSFLLYLSFLVTTSNNITFQNLSPQRVTKERKMLKPNSEQTGDCHLSPCYKILYS
jgi:hypothetical protein